MKNSIQLNLKDEEWEFTYIDHDRQIARAIVIDDNYNFYFVRVLRDDIFGQAQLIETAGGGVENHENLDQAIIRELKEELGVEVEIISKLGIVSDYYNLIHRHNINHYFLCKIKSFGEVNMTEAEINDFHLSTLKLSYQEAIAEYIKCSEFKLGKLIANREVPVLKLAYQVINNMNKNNL